MIPAPLGRLPYKAAYLVLAGWSQLFHPRTRGVKCVLCAGDEILLVRHSYGPRQWDLPGGFVRRGESFAAAGRRELREELDVPDPVAVSELGTFPRAHLGRRETLGGVRFELGERRATIRTFELAEVRWVRRDGLPPRRAPVVDEVLALEAGLSPSAQG